MSCNHYFRFSIPICNDCVINKKIKEHYGCHNCHNEEEFHKMDRSKVKLMKCLLCKCVQPKSDQCINPECYAPKHTYYCGKCSLWENKVRKEIYHCDKCGICRVGYKDFSKHCDKCNTCYNKNGFDQHVCVIDYKDNSECLICLEDAWGSQQPISTLQCGHIYHSNCLEEWFKYNYNYTCPTCKKSAYKPLILWKQIELYVNASQFTDPEMNNWKTLIYCNDCEKKSETTYHPVYHKCSLCESWNTTIDEIKK